VVAVDVAETCVQASSLAFLARQTTVLGRSPVLDTVTSARVRCHSKGAAGHAECRGWLERDGQYRASRRARSGDRQAFAELILRHQRLLSNLCSRALGDADLADDAVQEAILQALLSLDSLRQPAQLGAWLVGIGLNVCRRWLRSRPTSSSRSTVWTVACTSRTHPDRWRRTPPGLPKSATWHSRSGAP
jgi:hypothetical protein